jgi:hypothetical protein
MLDSLRWVCYNRLMNNTSNIAFTFDLKDAAVFGLKPMKSARKASLSFDIRDAAALEFKMTRRVDIHNHISVAFDLSAAAGLHLQMKSFGMHTPAGDAAVRKALGKHLRQGVQVEIKVLSASWIIADAFFEAVSADLKATHAEVSDAGARRAIQSLVEKLLAGGLEAA